MLNTLHTIPMPISILNEDGSIRYVNHATEKYLGVASEDIIGKDCHEILHPSNLSKESCPVCQAIQTKSDVHELELHNPLKQTTVQYSLNFTQIESKTGIIHTCKDVTRIHKQSKEIELLNNRIALSLKGFNAGMYEWDMLDNSAYLSSEWKVMLGYDKDEVFPKNLSTWKDRVHPDDIDTVMQDVQVAISSQEAHIETTHRLKHKDGHWVWILGRGFIQYDENANPLRMVGIHTDISKNKEREALIQKQADSLYYLAHYDMLTGLANRVLLTDRLQQAIKKAIRYKTKLALFFIDINKFKTINDSLGHHVGDKVLKEIAKRLKGTIREEDTIARFGGDEFIILLENTKNVSVLKEKIQSTFKEAIYIDEHALNITCSIGVSIYPDDADTIDKLLKDADRKMYSNKGHTSFVSTLH